MRSPHANRPSRHDHGEAIKAGSRLPVPDAPRALAAARPVEPKQPGTFRLTTRGGFCIDLASQEEGRPSVRFGRGAWVLKGVL